MGLDPQKLLRDPYRILIRETRPVTPCGLAPKSVVGDPIEISTLLVSDGHGILGAQCRWRTRGGFGNTHGQWNTRSMDVDPWGRARCVVVIDTAGDFEFEIRAWPDNYATWRRDLLLRRDAGEDIEVEFAEGALILKDLLGSKLVKSIPKEQRASLTEAIELLENPSCSTANRVNVAIDGNLGSLVSSTGLEAEASRSRRFPFRVDTELAVRGAWYEFFPRSEGGFRKGARSWDRLRAVAEAGFDVVYLPPIHPIGVTHRKGRNNSLVADPGDVGSPWAIGSSEGGHTAIAPELGDIEDFSRFVERANELGIEIALDFALQCSPDHPWVTEHPEWFTHRVDGSIRYAENPPKKYQDIYPINFWPESEADRLALWEACREILAFWISKGISVFRVDNPHTKPLAFWQWLIAAVHSEHPQVVFLSEAFTDPPMMHSLGEIGFSQSYTYFTWRESKSDLTSYGEELARGYAAGWFRPNLWPNTPDILVGSLRDGSLNVFAQRALLASTLAPSWGVYSGYELGENDPFPGKDEHHFSEKYQIFERDHADPKSLWPLITTLNKFRREHRSTWRLGSLHFHQVDNDDVIAYSYARQLADATTDRVLVVVNLTPDETREATVTLDLGALLLEGVDRFLVTDALSGESWVWSGAGNYVRLDPSERVGHLFKITADADSLRK
ncbi:MAG TPA: maltotransferase domain-containing protein [Microthrixaceae bacterium]|nr:maltotransferase domain-containing protein [Microthrixaceae bacterium]